MVIKRIIAIYLSPNGSTREIVQKITRNIGKYEIEEIDLNSVESRNKKMKFSKDELVIIGFPVYADRLPAIADKILKNIDGSNTPTVPIVSYGNRDYGDALLELKNKLKEVNMKTISAAAIIGEHCLNNNVAKGRPDEKDDIKILEYADRLSRKIENISNIEQMENLFVKGQYPYKALKPQRTPQGDDKCIQCGLCEENCPVNAIDTEDYRITDEEICIFCGRCINICPTNARDIKEKSFVTVMSKLEEIAKVRREIEVFI